MVPPGWSTPISFFQNATCCDGEILETLPPDLKNCIIQNMTYLIDTSGSMGGSRVYWLPAALQMVDFMMSSQVDPHSFTLMDYVSTVQITSTHSSGETFKTAIEAINYFSGGTELTFGGLLEALKLAACHNFIMVFTDEIGNDTNDPVLKEQILNLRDATQSIIFFMIVGSLPMFEAVFGDIGHVFQINVPEDELSLVLQNVTDIMINSDICNQNCSGLPSVSTPAPRPPSGPTPILRRRKYYQNPPDYFSGRTKKEFVNGFGDKSKEFWIGLKELSDMTSSGSWSLIVEVSNSSTIIAGHYEDFKVDYNKKTSKYKLNIGQFYSYSYPPLGDCLSKADKSFFEYPNTDTCSTLRDAGWWYPTQQSGFSTTTSYPGSDCGCSSLMGTFGATDGKGVIWGDIENISFAELRISPTPVTSPPPVS